MRYRPSFREGITVAMRVACAAALFGAVRAQDGAAPSPASPPTEEAPPAPPLKEKENPKAADKPKREEPKLPRTAANIERRRAELNKSLAKARKQLAVCEKAYDALMAEAAKLDYESFCNRLNPIIVLHDAIRQNIARTSWQLAREEKWFTPEDESVMLYAIPSL
jgi:hypothetical protein